MTFFLLSRSPPPALFFSLRGPPLQRVKGKKKKENSSWFGYKKEEKNGWRKRMLHLSRGGGRGRGDEGVLLLQGEVAQGLLGEDGRVDGEGGVRCMQKERERREEEGSPLLCQLLPCPAEHRTRVDCAPVRNLQGERILCPSSRVPLPWNIRFDRIHSHLEHGRKKFVSSSQLRMSE